MTKLRIVGLCGSLRAGSFNRRVMNLVADAMGDDVTFEEIRLDWPLFDGDVEASSGVPHVIDEAAQNIKAADAVIIAAPEYNKGITGVLKNGLDWLSRTPHKPFAQKPVAFVSAAAGRTGGETAHYMTKACVMALGADIISLPPVIIASVQNEFDETGLTNERYDTAIKAMAEALKTRLT